MEIRTKFNVNDEIWHLERVFNEENEYFETIVCPVIKRIVGIDIFCWKEFGSHREITYLTEYLDGTTCILHLPEQDCFATKEEAQKECDKRNGKE